MATTDQNTIDEQLDSAISKFKEALMNKDGGFHGKLWVAWHYLQLFSSYGMRLPTTEKALKDALGIENPGAYTFFAGMQEDYKTIYDESYKFRNEIFPEVLEVGDGLSTFAGEAIAEEEGLFDYILEIIDSEDPDDRALLLDTVLNMQKSAKENVAKAHQVKGKLNTYSLTLETLVPKLARLKKQVESDDKTSTETIIRLQGTDGTSGKIAELKKLLESDCEEYKQDVIIASTTPTYGWVPIWGWIAGGVVATIYGVKAIEKLTDIDKDLKNIAANQKVLHAALNTHAVLQTADEGICKAATYTKDAINQVVVVQNAWSALDRSLASLKSNVDKLTNSSDEQEKLRAKNIVKHFAKVARNHWKDLYAVIKPLMDEPYFPIIGDDLDIAELIKQIEAASAQ